MKYYFRILTFLVIGLSIARAEKFQAISTYFYVAPEAMDQRMPDRKPLQKYIQKIQVVLGAYLAHCSSEEPGILDVVVALAPLGKTKAWLLVKSGKIESEAEIVSALETISAPLPKDGPLALCLRGSLNGATETTPSPLDVPPEWNLVLKHAHQTLSLDDILNITLADADEKPDFSHPEAIAASPQQP